MDTQPGNEPKFLFEVSGTSYQISVVDFNLNERISFPFEVTASLACEDEINFDDVVGKEALLTILSDDKDRYCHGIISQFMQIGISGRFYLYRAIVVPSLWLLSHEQDCRIFQNKTVEDIVKQVLQDAGITSDRFDFRLQNSLPPREYCVQYRESDLNFISRLIEEEGIFYFFEHSKNKHVLVFGDSTVAYKPIQGKADVTFNPAGMVEEEEAVYGFSFSKQVFSGKITQKDFNFEKPSLDLKSEEKDKSYQKLEVYDYPGKYADQGRGKKLTKIRLEESMTFKERGEGQSRCPRFTPGFKYKLTDHDRRGFNQEYLLVEVRHSGGQPQVLEEQARSDIGLTYSNYFLSIPSSGTLRPERKSLRPVVEGLQTAIVTGPQNEEIYTDEYGRVKVQFHWDREGNKDDKTTCWIRVGQVWAGKGWGAVFIPRVGDEVLVDFLEGDPDKPIIVGSVYNEDQKPLYPLPDEKTKSTIKTKSYPNDSGYNEIRFEDNKGKEEIYIHSQKDMSTVVENDQSATIKSGNRTVTVESGTLTETSKGNASLTVQAGSRTVSVTGGKYDAKSDSAINLSSPLVDIGNATIKIHGSSISIEAQAQISLTVGGTSLTLTPGALTTSSPAITTTAGSSHDIKGAIVKHNC